MTASPVSYTHLDVYKRQVFDCEEDAIEAIRGGKIVAGDVVVIRYEGQMCIRDRRNIISAFIPVNWMNT